MNNKLLKELANRYPEEVLYPFDALFEAVGFESICAFAEEFGGSSVYVPSAKTIFSGCIAKQMQEDFNGVNLRELCKTYGFCEKTVKRMLER